MIYVATNLQNYQEICLLWRICPALSSLRKVVAEQCHLLGKFDICIISTTILRKSEAHQIIGYLRQTSCLHLSRGRPKLILQIWHDKQLCKLHALQVVIELIKKTTTLEVFFLTFLQPGIYYSINQKQSQGFKK